jgi:hypothetical protein
MDNRQEEKWNYGKKRGTLYGRWREVEEMQITEKVGVLHNGIVTTNRRTSISESAPVVYDSSPAASAPSSFSAGLSNNVSIFSKLAHYPQ